MEKRGGILSTFETGCVTLHLCSESVILRIAGAEDLCAVSVWGWGDNHPALSG